MVQKTIKNKVVCVVGLGYVGLPLAQDFSRHIRTIGFRRDKKKVHELNAAPGNRIEATTDPSLIRDFIDSSLVAQSTGVVQGVKE